MSNTNIETVMNLWTKYPDVVYSVNHFIQLNQLAGYMEMHNLPQRALGTCYKAIMYSAKLLTEHLKTMGDDVKLCPEDMQHKFDLIRIIANPPSKEDEEGVERFNNAMQECVVSALMTISE